MYSNESVNDYIRSILGYPTSNNIYGNTMSKNTNAVGNNQSNMEELEECYPEIYKIIHPMILKRCSTITTPVNRQMLEDLTSEIYLAIEANNEINVNINLQNETTGNTVNQTNSSKETGKQGTEEKRGETRQFKNSTLRDLIKILLIQELLRNRRNNTPQRPPFSNNQPPFLGGSMMSPIMPRGYNYMDIYEQY